MVVYFLLFLLKETDLKIADLSSVPRATHELWHDLKMALISKSFFSNSCSKSVLDVHQDEEKRKSEKMRMELGIRKPNYVDPRYVIKEHFSTSLSV